jgi:bile acid-coenzyme A ligase
MTIADMPARPMSMGFALSWQAARDPTRPALTMGEQTYTRGALDRAANRLARALAERGVGKDDRVAIVLPTGPRHQITCFALWKLGALVMPMPPKLVNDELRHLAKVGNPKLIIGVDPGRLSECMALPADFEPDPALSDEPLPEVVATIWKASTSGGSTGMPKLIWENRSSLIHPAEPNQLLHMQTDDVILHPAGAYHNSAFCQTSWALCWGTHVILMQRFEPLEWLRIVDRQRVRWAYLVPTMMNRILAVPDQVRKGFDLSCVEVIMHMAAPCPPWVKEAWIKWLGPEKIWEIYAGTEGYGATMISGVEWLAHRGSVGRAARGTEIRDEDGAVLPPGQVGMIYFYPGSDNPFGHPNIALSYGDMGSLDADGYLYLADRRTDMILTGGVNLYPAEIEGVIEQFPEVVSAAVIGLPDPDLGAKAHAIVELPLGHAAPAPAALAAFLATRLSRHKIPYTCEFVTESLRDDAGKVRRKRLREQRLTTASQAHYHALR